MRKDVSSLEIELIKNTQLFTRMDKKHFNEMLRSIQLIKYQKEKIIFREGEQGDALYIVVAGSVRVFTYDKDKVKIPLARLNKGDYFGEQALLGQANKTRNANIEAILDTTLIQIDEKFITQLLQIDIKLKEKLKNIGNHQAIIKKKLLQPDLWLQAVMKKITMHNAYVCSYLLEPVNSHFKTLIPGQHIIIQTQVGDYWVERPYTISDLQHNGNLRITIKKEPDSLFSQWLFASKKTDIDVNVTQPQGNFTLDQHVSSPAVCFAGGIGITPFITFAKSLSLIQSRKRMHILYSALTKDDFILTDEFDEIARLTPFFTITYRATNVSGLLTKEEIIKAVQELNEPDVYICGPEGFVQLIQKTLQEIHYKNSKIHVEEFSHAGVQPM